MADDVQYDDEQENEAPKDDANLKRLREKAAKADAAERELVFLKAKVDTDTPLGKLLLKSYDGEMTVDAVKEFARELGAIEAPASATPVIEFSDDEKALASDRAVLAGGRTEPLQDEGEDPSQAGLKAFHARMQRGSTRDNAAGEFYDRIFDAAAKDDPRVIYDRERFKERIQQGL